MSVDLWPKESIGKPTRVPRPQLFRALLTKTLPILLRTQILFIPSDQSMNVTVNVIYFFKNVIFDLIFDKFVKFVENSQNCQIWQKLYNLLKF